VVNAKSQVGADGSVLTKSYYVLALLKHMASIVYWLFLVFRYTRTYA